MRNDRLPFFSGHLEAFFAPLVQSFGKAFLVLDEKKKKRDKKEMDWAKISGREGLITPSPFPFPSFCFFVVYETGSHSNSDETWGCGLSVFCRPDSRKFLHLMGLVFFIITLGMMKTMVTTLPRLWIRLVWPCFGEFYLPVLLQMLVGKKFALVYIFKPI